MISRGAASAPASGVVTALVATFSTQTMAAATMIGPSVLAPVAARALELPPERIGIFVALNYLIAMFSGLGCAAFVFRIGGLRVCQLSLALAGLGLALAGLGSVWLMLPAACLIGMGYGCINPASSHILIDRTPRPMLGLVLSVKQTGVPAGGALAGAIIPTVTLALGWKATLEALAAASFLLAVGLSLARERLREHARPQTARAFSLSWQTFARPLSMVSRSPTLLMLGFASLVYSALQVNLTTYLVSYLNVSLERSLVAAGLLFSATQAAGIVGRILWGLVADRMRKPIRLMGFLGCTSGLCAFAVAAARSDWSIGTMGPLCLLFGATAIGWNGVFFALVARAAPDGEESTVTGGVQFLSFFGALAAPPLFALTVSVGESYAVAFGLFGAASLAMGTALMLSRRLTR